MLLLGESENQNDMNSYLENALIAACWKAGRIFLPSSLRHSPCCTIRIVMSWCWERCAFRSCEPRHGRRNRRACVRGPAESVRRRKAAGLGRGHLPNRLLGEVAFSLPLAALEDHAAEERNVGGGRKQATGRKRHAPAARTRIDERQGRHFLQAGLVGRGLVGLGQALELRRGGPKGRVLHAQGLEESLGHELLVGHPANHFDDAAGRVDAGIAVLVLAPRLELQGTRRVALDRRTQGRHVPSLPPPQPG